MALRATNRQPTAPRRQTWLIGQFAAARHAAQHRLLRVLDKANWHVAIFDDRGEVNDLIS
jgi:hypothetical protein